MADQESTLVAFELAKTAVEQVCAAYEFALELQEILRAFGEPESPPPWVFTLSRMAERACNQADEAHTAALRVRALLEGVPA